MIEPSYQPAVIAAASPRPDEAGADEAGAVAAGPDLARRYFLYARCCLLLACLVPLVQPRWIAGFYYHGKMLAFVHLITLGWITSSILGALYLIAPRVFGRSLRRGRIDRWAYRGFILGSFGLMAHFWIDERSGMAGSALLAWLAMLWVAWRLLRAVRSSDLPPQARVHFQLACGNVLLAGGLGVVIGLDKWLHLLPGVALDRVFAHAHLAALGWAAMMVLAPGYQGLAKLLPASGGRWLWLGGALFEVGVIALAVAFLVGGVWRPVAALLTLFGLAGFLGRVHWMRPRAAAGEPEPWPGRFLAAALLGLSIAALLGLALALAPPAAWKLPVIMAYGVFGLLGFLAQMVLAVSQRLLGPGLPALLGAASGAPESAVAPLSARQRLAPPLIWTLWNGGVVLLALGLGFDHLAAIRLAAACLALAAGLDWYNLAPGLRRLAPPR